MTGIGITTANDARGKILVVDDMSENLILLEHVLKSHDYQVRAVDNGEAALRAAGEFLPEIILLDVHMPDMDGYNVCELLKSDERTRDIPVIFISALDATDDKVRGFRAGGVDYIPKPIAVEEVLARVETHLSIRRLRDQLQQLNQELAKRVKELTESQHLLYERESKLNAFIHALPNLSFVIDEDGRYLEVMANETSLLHARTEEIQGRLIQDVVPPDVATMMMDAIGRVIETAKTQVIEYKLRVLTGQQHWFEGRISLMEKTESGRSRVVFIATEISDRIDIYHEVQRLAAQDPLTDCYNRRRFIELANMEFQRAVRYGRPLSLFMFDIDHFKKFNDRHGHPTGDRVLCALVDVCNHSLRNTDILGRYGGEEFIVLVPETRAPEAVKAADRLRGLIADMKVVTDQGELSITVSMGVARLRENAGNIQSIDHMIKQADKALYKAKADGRNCVRLAKS
jgi:diguanylate cyclase (GGDEF)-like protein/PAS domain S-box-containing protein